MCVCVCLTDVIYEKDFVINKSKETINWLVKYTQNAKKKGKKENDYIANKKKKKKTIRNWYKQGYTANSDYVFVYVYVYVIYCTGDITYQNDVSIYVYQHVVHQHLIYEIYVYYCLIHNDNPPFLHYYYYYLLLLLLLFTD